MFRNTSLALALGGLLILSAGCWNNVDSVQQARPKDSLIPYGPAFEAAFTDITWKEIPGSGKEKLVQFDAKISPSLHAFAAGKINAVSDITMFSLSCGYLGSLIKNGKAAGDPLIKFDTAGLPIAADGTVQSDSLSAYLDNPANRSTVLALTSFYRERYWQENSPVSIVFAVHGIKDAEAVKVANIHWDNDPIFAGKTADVLQMIYEYVKPIVVVE